MALLVASTLVRRFPGAFYRVRIPGWVWGYSPCLGPVKKLYAKNDLGHSNGPHAPLRHATKVKLLVAFSFKNQMKYSKNVHAYLRTRTCRYAPVGHMVRTLV